MIENKYRGPLTEPKLKNLVQYLEKNGTLIKAEREQAIYFDTSIFPQIGDFATGFSRISLKVHAKTAELRMKVGNPSEPRREKIMVTIPYKQTKNLILILNHLGLKNGFYRPAFRQDFAFMDIIISIKSECVMGSHFEINLKNEEETLPGEIKTVLKSLHLSFWSKSAYQQRIARLMKTSPAMNVHEASLLHQMQNAH